jgi:hypothetical protein
MPDKLDKLVDKVIEQIQLDIRMEDFTAIDELLKFCPIVNLYGFLREEGETPLLFDREAAEKEIRDTVIQSAHQGRFFVNDIHIYHLGNHYVGELTGNHVFFTLINAHAYSLKYKQLSDELIKKLLVFVRKYKEDNW